MKSSRMSVPRNSHRSLDARSEFVIDTHDLGRRAGAMKQLNIVAAAPADLGTAVMAVPSGTPISLALRIEAVVEGVLVTGVGWATAAGECGRCLVPISLDVEVDLQELFVHGVGSPDDDETSRLDGDLLDLEPVLRDQVVLDLPFQPICREDCLGLCIECGARLNDDPEHSHDDQIDPRWGGLTGLELEPGT